MEMTGVTLKLIHAMIAAYLKSIPVIKSCSLKKVKMPPIIIANLKLFSIHSCNHVISTSNDSM